MSVPPSAPVPPSVPPPDPRAGRGRRAEAWVAEALQARGWRVLGRNLRTPLGEVDILALAADAAPAALVAVEVKARHPLSWTSGEDALRPQQRRRLARALMWSAARLGWRGPLRLDLAAVEWIGDAPAGFELLEGVEVL
ncbi:MAG: YraN family protein [Planctomycetota bacterium]|nr:MAG: YraN family protein [Planctomycetota bacterium]